MATFVLPVTVGRTNGGATIARSVGTFSSASEAESWGMKLKLAGDIIDYEPAQELMTLVQFASWRTSLRKQAEAPQKG